MLLILINFISSLSYASIIPGYGAEALALSEGGRSIISGSSAIRLNPASTYTPDSEEKAIHLMTGPHYATLSGSTPIDENFNLYLGINDIDRKLSIGSADIFLSYANEINDWITAGMTLGYSYSPIMKGFDSDIGINLGRRNNGFLTSAVARNLMANTGYRELGMSFGYSFMSKVYTSMDHLMVIVNNRPRYDIVFASFFWVSDSFALRGSFRFIEIASSSLDTGFGLGLSYHTESFRFDFGVSGNNFDRLIYGISFVRGTWGS